MKFHNIEQNTPEWLTLRRGKITGSMFSDIMMKLSTAGYQNAINKVIFERITGETPDSFSNGWTQRGHDLEPEAIKVYEFETFNKTHNGGFFELNEWVGVSPDRTVDDNGLVEAKCPKYSTLITYLLNKKLPNEYKWQVHGQLWVTEREWCDFLGYHPLMNPLIIRVYRDEEAIKELQERVNYSIEIIQQKLELLNVR